MNQTPPEAKRAVERILTKANPENEAAYAVIFRAVKICIDAGMNRKEAARYLGVSARRIDKHGQYFRTARSVKILFSEAVRSTSIDSHAEEAQKALVAWAWRHK
ncbi:hypothetical protein [Arthrobacter sedimenti]|uniref:hypothetical protein n=1 Tax=Arthrobacter sedimenti TaxID=2694931 RepID=UPI000B35D6FC|nr:hypothetical protein [Arthrobacter sedimenti]OUM44678.1 hypothetical protein B8W73_02710 [Arthrobacter agilis]